MGQIRVYGAPLGSAIWGILGFMVFPWGLQYGACWGLWFSLGVCNMGHIRVYGFPLGSAIYGAHGV